MADRPQLALLSALFVMAVSVPTPTALSADVMTRVPAAALLEALDQGTPDAACAAQCQRRYDADMKSATRKLSEKAFFAGMMNGDCDQRWNEKGNACTATYTVCEGPCGLYDPNCKRPCFLALQTCCHGNVVANAAHNLDECFAECPRSKEPPVVVPSPAATGDPEKGATLDKKAAWTSLLKNASTMLDALAPAIERLDLERFNDLRRSLAFMQVTATLAETNGKFAVVSGGAERLWIILPGGKQIPLGEELGKIFRGHSREIGTKRLDADLAAIEKVKTLTGLSNIEVGDLFNAVQMADVGRPFPPGEILIFPKGGGWPPDISKRFTVSSEHSSVRGTINGGGDFI